MPAQSIRPGWHTKSASPIWKAVRADSRSHPVCLRWRQCWSCSIAAHIVASDDLYGGTFRLFDRVRRRSANLDFTNWDLTDAKDLERAIKPNTRLVWIETPSNPLLKLIDLEAIAKIARKRRLISVSDNTFATPWMQRPIELGFDIVLRFRNEIFERAFRSGGRRRCCREKQGAR